MTLRQRIVRKTITVTAAPKPRRRMTLGSKPVLTKVIPIISENAYVPGDGERFGNEAQRIIAGYNAKIRNPMTAIRAKCVECSGGSLKEVAECRVVRCALHPFRMGVNPHNKRVKERLEGTEGTDNATDEDDSAESGETE